MNKAKKMRIAFFSIIGVFFLLELILIHAYGRLVGIALTMGFYCVLTTLYAYLFHVLEECNRKLSAREPDHNVRLSSLLKICRLMGIY